MTSSKSTLWLTLPAPARSALAGWFAWTLAAAVVARMLVGIAGPAGVAVGVVVAGVWLARLLPGPL